MQASNVLSPKPLASQEQEATIRRKHKKMKLLKKSDSTGSDVAQTYRPFTKDYKARWRLWSWNRKSCY